MTSKKVLQNAAIYAEVSSENPIIEGKVLKTRKITVYDAVAGTSLWSSFALVLATLDNTFIGRISAAGFIPKHLIISSNRDTPSSSASAVAPEAVLFRRKNAPTRYAESDFYFANERGLRIDLPDSDLLKALHCYISDFYSRATADGGAGDWRSLDETALIALGVLMEEACRDTLGQTGDLAFTEGEQTEEPSIENWAQSITSAPDTLLKSSRVRRSKRRRVSQGL